MPQTDPVTGSCPCQTLTYSVLCAPIRIHACHCTQCQRETGSAFAVNAFIEASNVKFTSETQPLWTSTPSASGRGQLQARCPQCYTPLISQYGGSANPGKAWVIRVGTLDRVKIRYDDGQVFERPVRWEVQAHIWTKEAMHGVMLPEHGETEYYMNSGGEGDGYGRVEMYDEGYDPRLGWGEESLRRYRDLFGRDITWW